MDKNLKKHIYVYICICIHTDTDTHTHTLACSVASAVSDSFWPMDYSSPGSSVHGLLQARILEWVAMPSSRGSSWSRSQVLYPLSHLGSHIYIYIYIHTHTYTLYLLGDGQGGLACCDSWGCKESDTTERLNWTDTYTYTYMYNWITLLYARK